MGTHETMRQNGNHKQRPRNRGNLGRKPSNNRNQTFDSNGPSVRIRGNAFQVHEKYLTLARDAYSSGDRVMAENFFQHAEHYYRIVNATTDPSSQGQRVNGYSANANHSDQDEGDDYESDGDDREYTQPTQNARRDDGEVAQDRGPARTQNEPRPNDADDGGGRRRGRRPNAPDRGEQPAVTADPALPSPAVTLPVNGLEVPDVSVSEENPADVPGDKPRRRPRRRTRAVTDEAGDGVARDADETEPGLI